MKSIKIEVKKQRNMIAKFKQMWKDEVSYQEDGGVIKKWFYEFTIFMAYHFYTEEYFLDQDSNCKKHIDAHRHLLREMLLVLISSVDVASLKSMIGNFLSYYQVSHVEKLEHGIEYDTTVNKSNYFQPEGYHGGFILIAFKKGYYTLGFGTVTKEVADNYILDIEAFDPDWVKFVDLTRWQYITQDAVKAAYDVNRLEINYGLRNSYFVLNDDGISAFSVGQFLNENQQTVFFNNLSEVFRNGDLHDLFSSDILGIHTISSSSFIDAYFESVLGQTEGE